MKIIRFNLARLRNEEWFEFYGDFIGRISLTGEDALGIKKLNIQLQKIYNKADEELKVVRESIYTHDMDVIEKFRDETFRGLAGVIKSMRLHPDPEKRRIAEQLYIYIKTYKREIEDSSQLGESGSISNLIMDFIQIDDLKKGLTTLSLSDWRDALATANHDYVQARQDRYAEYAAKPKDDFRETRQHGDKLYRAVINYLESVALAEGLDEYKPEGSKDTDLDKLREFMLVWNETVKTYRNLLAQRSGFSKKDEEEEESEE